MAKKSARSRTFVTTKKHLARQERERRQRRAIIIGSIIVISLAVLLVGYGIIQYTVIQPNQPVAIVNGDEISTRDWQQQTEYYRFSIIRNIENTLQFASFLGDDPNSLASINSQIQQLQSQLDPPEIAGQATLNEMIDNALIKQEADTRGITVSEEEIETQFQAAFGYYAGGTPTPTMTQEILPTSTLSSLQQTLIPPTSTPTSSPTPEEDIPTSTPSPTAEPTVPSTPEPTATEFTLEGYQNLYRDSIDSFVEAYNISASTIKDGLRASITDQLYRDKLFEDMASEVSCSEEQVWARHILVEDESTANDVLNRLREGDNFCDLAAEFSTDTSNKDDCGDLGWFGEGSMVAEFQEAAYSLEIGELSDPVETEFGFHIIQSLGNEVRQLSSFECGQRKDTLFQNWLTETRNNSEIEIMDYWVDRVPSEPTVPLQIELYIQQVLQNTIQQNPTLLP